MASIFSSQWSEINNLQAVWFTRINNKAKQISIDIATSPKSSDDKQRHQRSIAGEDEQNHLLSLQIHSGDPKDSWLPGPRFCCMQRTPPTQDLYQIPYLEAFE